MPGKIHVPVTVATDGFDKIQRAFGRLKGVALGVTAAIAGLGAAARAIDFTGAAIQGARDLERNYAGLESVFKDATQQMKDFGTSASEMGLSMNEAAKATTFIGSVLKQSGFSISETADLTEELVELGADLALTYGYDVQEALLGMTALFRGEYDPIEKFGVAMKQSEIDAEKAARGLDGLTGAAERFADQQIRVEFLMERAGDAMGAFERQSGNLTVQQMRLRAEFENIRDTIADDLLPPIAEFTGGLREIVQEVGPQLEDVFSDLAPVLEEMGEDALPLIQAGIEGVIAFAGQLVEFLDEALDPSTELGQSFQDLGTAFSQLIGDTSELPTMEQHFDNFTNVVIELNDALAELVITVDEVKDPIVSLFEDIGKAIEATGLSEEETTAVGIVATVGLLATNLERVSKVVKKIPKTGLIGVALFGAGAIGSETEDSLDRARQKIQDYEGDLDDLYYTTQNSADSFAYMEAKGIELGQELGVLDAQGNVLRGSVETLGEKLGFSANETDNLVSNFKGFRDITNGIAASKGLPTWLSGVADNAKTVADELREAERAALALSIASGQIQGSGSSAGEFIVPIDLNDFRKQLGLDEDAEEVVGKAATDYVAEFFDGIKEGIEKEAARLDLEELGLSAALIDQILGSQGWEELFQNITDGGADMARQLQDDFELTAAGMAELDKAAEELQKQLDGINAEIKSLNDQIDALELQRDSDIKDATESFMDFKYSVKASVDALDTYQRTIGQFEAQTNSDLQRIEGQIMSAFDNKYLLEDAKNNLLDYARAELNVLAGLQRQRDELLARRNAASDVILGVAQAVTSAGSLTSLLSDVQDSVQEVQVTEMFEDIVKSADSLNGFKVTLERNFTEVVTNTVSKSKALVDGFQAVIDRTRQFIDNLNTLRELGLDPFLFNQLVEAGAEAGGATAQALVDGGSSTVNEVNQLQTELESMGVELGEQTYEVTKNSGEQFVSGIIDGMDSELENLQMKAAEMAESFTVVFSDMFEIGMDNAFERITDTIKEEFREMIAELNAEIAKLERKKEELGGGTGSGASFTPSGPVLRPGDEEYGNVVRISGAGREVFTPEEYRDMMGFDASPETMSASSNVQTTTNNITITANSPLDAQEAGKRVVNALGGYQQNNGNFNVTLTGVGS